MTPLEPKEPERHKYKVLSRFADKTFSTIHERFYGNFIRIHFLGRNDQVEVPEVFFFQRSKNIWSW